MLVSVVMFVGLFGCLRRSINFNTTAVCPRLFHPSDAYVLLFGVSLKRKPREFLKGGGTAY